MGRVVKIPWEGGRYTMGRGVENTMGRGAQYTMVREVDISTVGGSKYHG